MATIVTVHGTGATGPEEGDRWWQRGSAFETHLRELVEGVDGTLSFDPSIWDGGNSEASRRAAGKALLARMRAHEKNGEPYALIGHSHGGSVIAAALVDAAARPAEFPRLARWITVGTPFIRFARSLSTFAKLNTIWKSAYLAALLCSAFLFWFALGATNLDDYRDTTGGVVGALVLLFAICFVPFGVAFFIFRSALRRRLGHYNKGRLRASNDAFGSKWTAFYHVNDEAVQSLGVLRDSRIDFFPRDFAVAPLTTVALFIVPIVVVLLAAWPSASLAAFDFLVYVQERTGSNYHLGGEHLSGVGADYRANLEVWTKAVLMCAQQPISFVLRALDLELVFDDSAIGIVTSISMILLLAVVLFVESAIILIVLRELARLVSRGLSRILNRITWAQVCKASFGSDMLGEHAVGAGECPSWMATGVAPLPAELADEISQVSNAAASKAIAKFRAALQFRAGNNAVPLGRSLFAEVLTWDELVHTAYFNVPRFRKLLAYALTQSGGFRATDAFKADPDYGVVARWFEEIRADPRGA